MLITDAELNEVKHEAREALLAAFVEGMKHSYTNLDALLTDMVKRLIDGCYPLEGTASIQALHASLEKIREDDMKRVIEGIKKLNTNS